MRPASRVLTQVASIQRYGQSPSSVRLRNAPTCSSSSPHSRETRLLETPVMPSVLTRSSMERVEMAPPRNPGQFRLWPTGQSSSESSDAKSASLGAISCVVRSRIGVDHCCVSRKTTGTSGAQANMHAVAASRIGRRCVRSRRVAQHPPGRTGCARTRPRCSGRCRETTWRRRSWRRGPPSQRHRAPSAKGQPLHTARPPIGPAPDDAAAWRAIQAGRMWECRATRRRAPRSSAAPRRTSGR